MSLRTSLVVASVMVLASATPALALDHLMKVGEVLLANSGGSANVQYIELEDPGETFPNPPYIVEIFSAAGGAPLITYPVTVPSGTTRLMLSTAAAATAFGFTSAATLTQTLPTNGQACFSRNPSAPQRIHCLAWGTITGIVPGAGTMNNGASPPNGMSVQRVNNTYVVAAPTPNAPNSNGTTPMVDAPPTLDAPPPIDAPAATPDAPGNPVTPGDDDDGCSVRSGASWFGLVMLGLLLLVRRSSTQRKR